MKQNQSESKEDKVKRLISELISCITDGTAEEKQINEFYDLLQESKTNSLVCSMLIPLILHSMLSSPSEHPKSIIEHELSKEEATKVNELLSKRNHCEEVIRFLDKFPAENSTDYYDNKYPDIYRDLYQMKDVIKDALNGLNFEIQDALEAIDKGFTNVGNNPYKS